MYHLYTTEGFILKERAQGESNKIYHLLTPELGLIVVSAQSIRALQSKLRFHMTGSLYVKVAVVRGKEMWKLTGAEKNSELADIFQNEEKKKLVAKIFILLRSLIHGEGEMRALFVELKKAFLFLESYTEVNEEIYSAWEHALALKVLNYLGYLKEDVELKNLINFEIWTEENLKAISSYQARAAHLINMSLKHSHLG